MENITLREKQKTVFKSGCDAINTSNAWIAESMVKGELWRILLTKLGKYFPKITPLSKFEYKKLSPEEMKAMAGPMLKNQYGQYLLKVIDELSIK